MLPFKDFSGSVLTKGCTCRHSTSWVSVNSGRCCTLCLTREAARALATTSAFASVSSPQACNLLLLLVQMVHLKDALAHLNRLKQDCGQDVTGTIASRHMLLSNIGKP